ncbi:hypothetical protein BG61_24835 [Caballeronia glathei]|uniref:Uncharacterized protein n=1 Tax=Caballeronia glathei TaxID=60547 RepID=A0A069PUG8_9BURK|nr:hypothetical protein BG61_24835 [Caballeronia glathei]
MSKTTISASSIAAANGSTSSRFAPMPLNTTSGGVAPLPRRMPTRSNWPSISTTRVFRLLTTSGRVSASVILKSSD